jgi:hypothetical protein
VSGPDSELSSPPWGILLKRARESRRPKKLSMRAAAIRADVSETTWRHTEGGFEVKGGQRLPYRVGASTLARMALAVAIRPAELSATGREDAAIVLADMLARGEPDELTPECVVERGVFSTPGISHEFKLLFARQHRDRGHTEDCYPFEEAEAPRAESSLAG